MWHSLTSNSTWTWILIPKILFLREQNRLTPRMPFIARHCSPILSLIWLNLPLPNPAKKPRPHSTFLTCKSVHFHVKQCPLHARVKNVKPITLREKERERVAPITLGLTSIKRCRLESMENNLIHFKWGNVRISFCFLRKSNRSWRQGER